MLLPFSTMGGVRYVIPCTNFAHAVRGLIRNRRLIFGFIRIRS